MLCTMVMSFLVLVAAWVEEVASDACANPDVAPLEAIAASPAQQDKVLLQVGSRKGEVIYYHAKRNELVATKTTTTTTTVNATKNETCVTRKDERASAWWAATADEGTPCVFGVDMRDEGTHCVPEFDYGSNGWCYTDKEGNSWGSCSGGCPLYGAQKTLGDKIDAVGKSLDDILGIDDEDDSNATLLASDTLKEGSIKEVALELQLSSKGGKNTSAPNTTAKKNATGKNATKANVTKKPKNATKTTPAPDTKLVTPAPEEDSAANDTNATNSSCVTRQDPRAKAWWATTSPPGTPCVFGTDTRDEGYHCIAEFDFGTNGWCYTSDDQSSWGSCGGDCPLYGQHEVLGKKIDTVSEKLDNLTAVACIWTPPKECVAAFKYKGKWYKGCTMVDNAHPWCAHSVKYSKSAWSVCKSTCAGDRDKASSSSLAEISLLQVQDFQPWGEIKRSAM